MPPGGDPTTAPELDAAVGVMLALLWRSNHGLALLSKRMLRSHGVTGQQRMILRIIARGAGVSPGRISETASLHPSTLTGILERLVRGGFAVRSRDAGDGRRSRFDLTPRGRAVAEARQGTVESAMVRSLAPLSPEERAVVRRWLEAFGDALGHERALHQPGTTARP